MMPLKFKTTEDKVNGYYLLAPKRTVRSLPNDIFEVNDYMLEFLKGENVGFEVIERTAFDEAEKIRNTPAIVIQ